MSFCCFSRTTFFELNSAHAEELRDLGLLRRPTPSPTPTTASRPQRRRYKRRERKQKRGKRGGIRARLAANPHKPAIPTIVLANVRSLDNKLDYIRLLRSTQRTVRDCCVFVFTETWLNNSVPDCAIQLEQLTCYRADRALVEGGKRRGGGLCVYINNVWCRDAVVVCKHCITKQHHCTEDSTSSRRPGDDAVLGQREEIPQQDQCTQSSGSLQHSWACTERLCSGTHWCLHRHLQHLTKSGCCPHMLQSYHHHSSPEEVIPILLQWLLSSSTHSYSHEELWTASHATHQVCPPTPSLDPFQFAYRSNRSTDDAIATALHPALTHLDKKDSYVRMLFIDFSSAFNTIIPQQLTHKLAQLGLNTSLCNWLLDFLTGRPQAVRVGINTSSTITLNTGPPHKDVCWAPSSSLCWPTTAHRHTTVTFSSSLRMTRLWWVSSATEMRQTTGARWAAWLGGAGSTISLWMWRRRRRLLLTSGECTLSMLLWPSTVWLWRERAAPSSWVCTSQRTSPGLTTLQHWPRKHSSVSTSSANSEEPEPRPPSCALSTEAPSRASWLAASLCGMAPSTRPAASTFNG